MPHVSPKIMLHAVLSLVQVAGVTPMRSWHCDDSGVRFARTSPFLFSTPTGLFLFNPVKQRQCIMEDVQSRNEGLGFNTA